ncbi:MAG: ATP-binding protein [Sneathiellales bacterium]|nr:ATP-binding protein [Sneathiellales bacterium]
MFSIRIFSRLFAAFLALLFLAGLSLPAFSAGEIPRARNGVLDLRQWDFTGKGKLEIAGEWAFYWDRFIDPETGSAERGAGFSTIEVPGTWLGYLQKGEPLEKYGHATYALTILLPDRPQDLALYLQRVQDAYRLYVNGQLWMQAGEPASNANGSVALVTRDYEVLKQARGKIELLVHVSNHSSYAGGGFFNSFTIGPEKSQHLDYFFDLMQDFFLSGALVCLGIFIAILQVSHPREKAYFVLYVMSFSAAIYVININSAVHILLPDMPFYWSERLSYISSILLIGLIYEFIHQINLAAKHHFLSHIILYLAATLSVGVVLWPAGLPVELAYLLAAFLLIVSLSCFAEIRTLVIHKVPGRRLVTSAIAVLIFVGGHDLLNANGIITSFYLGPYGILLLLFFFAAILAIQVNKSLIENQRLAKAVLSMNDCVAIFDSRDRIVLWNDAYRNHLSSASKRLLKPGIPLIKLVRADAYSGELENAVGKEREYIETRMLRHKNPGTPFEIQRIKSWYLYSETKTPDGGSITFATDISDQKKKEAELQKAFEKLVTANEAKDSFLSHMSHELRTPLNAINGFSEMMAQEVFGPLNDQYQDYTHNIQQSGQHLLRLVCDMLDVAHLGSASLEVTPEEFNLRRMLEECLEKEQDRITKKKLHFNRQISDSIDRLYADPVRVRQIVFNLLDNAIKYTDPGGEISVMAKTEPGGCTQIQFCDTGKGLTDEQIETALEKFGQVRESHLNAHDGLGIGLSAAEAFMRLHGGTLTLSSEPGVGSCVTIRFPSREQSAAFHRKQMLA